MMPTKTGCLLILTAVAVGCGSKGGDMEGVDRAWPFAAWTFAKAYTYNFVPYAPGHRLTIFELGEGLHRNIRSDRPLPHEFAVTAAKQVASILGTQVTSNCPFPRHGIVYYDEDQHAVGAISVCFTCEDVIAWPDVEVSMARKARVNVKPALTFFEGLFARELHEPVFKTEQELRRYLDQECERWDRTGRRDAGTGSSSLATWRARACSSRLR